MRKLGLKSDIAKEFKDEMKCHSFRIDQDMWKNSGHSLFPQTMGVQDSRIWNGARSEKWQQLVLSFLLNPKDRRALYGFVRLRLFNTNTQFVYAGRDSAEVHFVIDVKPAFAV